LSTTTAPGPHPGLTTSAYEGEEQTRAELTAWLVRHAPARLQAHGVDEELLHRIRLLGLHGPARWEDTPSQRVHGRYLRRLADAALGGYAVVIELMVRRFKCVSDACPVGTFAEQVKDLTLPHARRTPLLQPTRSFDASRTGLRYHPGLSPVWVRRPTRCERFHDGTCRGDNLRRARRETIDGRGPQF
jgi:hypothetical protein